MHANMQPLIPQPCNSMHAAGTAAVALASLTSPHACRSTLQAETTTAACTHATSCLTLTFAIIHPHAARKPHAPGCQRRLPKGITGLNHSLPPPYIWQQ